LHHMFIDLRKQDPKVLNASQIRQSVISHWLTKFNLRTVQYMAGHIYVSSTEWYKRTDIQALKYEVNTYHPLRKQYSKFVLQVN
jgi:integrase/recombinase XerD